LGQKLPELEALGAQAVAVAVTSTFSQQAFARSLEARFPMLSDWGRTACAAYGVRYDVWKGHDGVAKRSVFVIDGDGVIRYRWVSEDALVLPDLDAAIAVLPAPDRGAGRNR
jgi:glutaredoxin-dependent peroxiredoxin